MLVAAHYKDTQIQFQSQVFAINFMHWSITVFLAALLVAGCAFNPDPIDRLVADLSSTHGMWRNGYFFEVHLPKTATAERIVEEYFKIMPFEQGKVSNYKIRKAREVHIPDSGRDEIYTAVLVETTFGEKIVLFKFEGGGWWSHAYDANKTYYPKINFHDTPLHVAVREMNKGKVVSLVANKAEVNAKDIFGRTPLFFAAMDHNKDIAELLIANHAEVNGQATDTGWTPLHMAAICGSKDVVALLLAHNANIHAKDKSGLTPLQAAVHDGLADKDVVELLLVNEAEVNVRDIQGETLLHYAAEWGNQPVAEVLLAHHAEINATNNYDVTPLLLALARNKDLAALLRQHGGHE